MQISTQQQRPDHDEIAALACHIWEQNGRPANKDIEFWLHAEQLLLSSFRQPRMNKNT